MDQGFFFTKILKLCGSTDNYRGRAFFILKLVQNLINSVSVRNGFEHYVKLYVTRELQEQQIMFYLFWFITSY
jgi:hypothetical protein